jgi:glycosyltransferase involved in cell wall biosynthesis
MKGHISVLRNKKILYVSDSLAANVHARGIFTFSSGLLRMLAGEGAELYLLCSEVGRFGVHPRIAQALGLSPEAAVTPAAASFFEHYGDGEVEPPKPGFTRLARIALRSALQLLLRSTASSHLTLRRIDPSLLGYTTDRSRFLRHLSGIAISRHVYEAARALSVFGIPGPRINARGFDYVIVDTPTNVRVTGSASVVQIIHDLIPLTDPTLGGRPRTMFATALSYAVRTYERFAFVSSYSRDQFLSLLPAGKSVPRTTVLYPRIAVPEKLDPVVDGPRYAAIVISDEVRKNIEKAIEAAADFDLDISLWVIGRAESLRFRRLLSTASARRANIRVLGYVSETQKAQIIRSAICVVVPAFSEGFGLPIVESFAQGTPVACSDTPLFREVAGDKAVYFDPYSPVSIARAVNEIAKAKEVDRDALRRAASAYDVGRRPTELIELLGATKS